MISFFTKDRGTSPVLTIVSIMKLIDKKKFMAAVRENMLLVT